MASGPITSWPIGGKTMSDFIFLGSKSTAVVTAAMKLKGDCSFGRKAMTNLDSILKSRDITLPTQVCLVKAMVASSHVWIWYLDHKESWELMNWCFWTPVLDKTLESPRDCKEIKPVNLKEISPEYPLVGLMLKLTLQYFGHLLQRTDLLEKTLMLGKNII